MYGSGLKIILSMDLYGCTVGHLFFRKSRNVTISVICQEFYMYVLCLLIVESFGVKLMQLSSFTIFECI